MRDQSRITTLQRSLSEWAGRAANERFLHDEQEQILREADSNRLLRAQVPIASWMLGSWHLAHGFARVMQGDGRGFDEARCGQALRRCSLLLRHRRGEARRRNPGELPFSLTQATVTALFGLALGDPGAEPLHDLVKAIPDRRFDRGDHLAMFARELLILRDGQRSTIPGQLGPYQKVILHWKGRSDVLALETANALDDHLERARKRRPPFDDPATQLYPFEVFAMIEVRRWLELPTPKIEHALMFTNLATMRPRGPWPKHELVTALERRLRRHR